MVAGVCNPSNQKVEAVRSAIQGYTVPGVVAHASDPSTWEAEVSLVYRASSRIARATRRLK